MDAMKDGFLQLYPLHLTFTICGTNAVKKDPVLSKRSNNISRSIYETPKKRTTNFVQLSYRSPFFWPERNKSLLSGQTNFDNTK